MLFPHWLARIAYPERFLDTPLDEEIKRYFEEILTYALSDDDVNTMLYPQQAIKEPGA